ncbi:MAG: hypothetical protein J6S93_10875, partial [Paludibacteraceae bacterium]|nr:hypothetical protein [Paludibacteraceae bacterium]
MKYMLNSMCKKFASERKMIVKFLFALVAAICFVPSYAAVDKYGNTVPTKNPLVYNGQEQQLVSGAKVVEPGEFQYSKEEEGTYSSTIPTAILPGKYDVWYKFVPEDPDMEPTIPVDIEVSVAKKSVPVMWGELDLPYNGSAQVPTASFIGRVPGDEVEIVVEGEKEYILAGKNYVANASLAGTDANKYKLSGDISIEFNIIPANITVGDFIAPTAKTNLMYNGTEQALVNEGEKKDIEGFFLYALGDGSFDTKVPTAKDPGSYTVRYKFKPSGGNYY